MVPLKSSLYAIKSICVSIKSSRIFTRFSSSIFCLFNINFAYWFHPLPPSCAHRCAPSEWLFVDLLAQRGLACGLSPCSRDYIWSPPGRSTSEIAWQNQTLHRSRAVLWLPVCFKYLYWIEAGGDLDRPTDRDRIWTKYRFSHILWIQHFQKCRTEQSDVIIHRSFTFPTTSTTEQWLTWCPWSGLNGSLTRAERGRGMAVVW